MIYSYFLKAKLKLQRMQHAISNILVIAPLI